MKKILKHKDIKELSPKIKTKEDTIKIILDVDKTEKLTLYETNKSIQLNLTVQRNAHIDIILVIKEKNKEVSVNAQLEEGSFARIICFSKKETKTKYTANCEQNSRFEAINFSLKNIDSESKTTLKDYASCLISNGYLNEESEKTTIKDTVIHEGKNTSSLINTKGYLKNSKTETRGLIIIKPQAFNAQGFQESHILLEGESNAITIPDLEILNNEVKCSHGSTTTRIKDEDLFYFESRGINKKQAKNIIIKGHLLSTIPKNEELIDFANKFIEERAL